MGFSVSHESIVTQGLGPRLGIACLGRREDAGVIGNRERPVFTDAGTLTSTGRGCSGYLIENRLTAPVL